MRNFRSVGSDPTDKIENPIYLCHLAPPPLHFLPCNSSPRPHSLLSSLHSSLPQFIPQIAIMIQSFKPISDFSPSLSHQLSLSLSVWQRLNASRVKRWARLWSCWTAGSPLMDGRCSVGYKRDQVSDLLSLFPRSIVEILGGRRESVYGRSLLCFTCTHLGFMVDLYYLFFFFFLLSESISSSLLCCPEKSLSQVSTRSPDRSRSDTPDCLFGRNLTIVSVGAGWDFHQSGQCRSGQTRSEPEDIRPVNSPNINYG